MSVIARKIAATPKRTATEAWQVVVGMVSDPSSNARKTLESVTGVVSAVIVDEILTDTPIIFTGNGPRIRIYCVYGEDALLDENCNEGSLVQKPTSEDWHVYLPCAEEDLSWITESLKPVSAFVTAYNKDKEPNIEKGDEESQSLTVDTTSFLNKL